MSADGVRRRLEEPQRITPAGHVLHCLSPLSRERLESDFRYSMRSVFSAAVRPSCKKLS